MLVEIWSDVVCPWCAIGKARFEQALADFEHADEVEVRWRSFELDPSAPRELDEDLLTHLARKYRTDRAAAQQMTDHMTGVAAQEGLAFDLAVARPGNTFDAHRLLHLARARDLQDELGTRLFAAYLCEGRAIADHDVLREVAVAAGLDEVEVREVLAGDRHAADVRADEDLARQYGITGVPFFVVDQRYGVSGAQPADTLLHVLRTARAEARPLAMVGAADRPGAHDHADGHDHAADAACADGSCAI